MSNTTKPTIEVITERTLFPAGQEQTADLLIRITPPKVEAQTKRHRLNLSLVLDRSGSMEGEKIARARSRSVLHRPASGRRPHKPRHI
jgi:Ca-activated chloride channel family protein